MFLDCKLIFFNFKPDKIAEMTNVFLKNNKGFTWFSNQTIFVKGCFFDDENNIYEKENLIYFFKDITTKDQFIRKLKKINGFFTVLLKISDSIFVASDTTRIFPLFYSVNNSQLYISDDIIFLKKKISILETNKIAAIDFRASGFTMGNKTLLKNIYQLQSSEYLIFQKITLVSQGFFFNYATNNDNKSTYFKLKEQAIVVFENAFKRLITSLNGRPVALPLSGGFDSRLIAVMLKKHNYKNVICYTYGKKGNIEIENSKKTAKALNFKWIFIEYSEELINNYIDSKIFREFVDYSCKYTSMPSLQGYFSVKYLSENNLIPSNSIFIPGYAGDLLGGSQYTKIIPNKLKPSNISNILLKEKFFNGTIKKTSKKAIKKRIEKVLIDFDDSYKSKIASTVFENYDIKEKIAKLIFKASNLYTFFEYEHRFPFWDIELLAFFRDVPSKYKNGKYLYDDILKNNYFNNYDVNFEKEIQPSLYNLYIQKIKNKIKPFFPYFIKSHFLRKNDWLNYEYITKEMAESMRINNLSYTSKVKTYNELNIQWYLYFVKGLIKQNKNEIIKK